MFIHCCVWRGVSGRTTEAMITHRLGVFYLPLVAGRTLVTVIAALCIAQEDRGANGGRQLEGQFYFWAFKFNTSMSKLWNHVQQSKVLRLQGIAQTVM